MVLDANPGRQAYFVYWFHADVSPDRAQLVYSSCQYPTEYEEAGISQADAEAILARHGPDWYERGKHHYEIALLRLDGSAQQRLTHNLYIDHYPVWLPNGDRIAFVSSPEGSVGHSGASTSPLNLRKAGLYIMSADGSDVLPIAPELRHVDLVAPVWSPDGQRLAFVVREGTTYAEEPRVVYIVRSDGSELVKIGEMGDVSVHGVAAPTWSPDSERVAFASNNGQEWIINTVRFDGADLEQIWSSGSQDHIRSITQVSWSPDGSELLFVYESVYIVATDGSSLRSLKQGGERTLAAWSPDGSRIATYHPGSRPTNLALLDASRDGTDLRILVDRDDMSQALCSGSSVFPQPETNPGRIQDCGGTGQ